LFFYANVGGLILAVLVVIATVVGLRRSGGPVREIADGIRNGEFIPYYQPVIDMVTGRLAGCEVLVRWRQRDGTLISPGRFIALAEASREIFPMTVALMETARNDLSESYAVRPDLKVGFNLFAGHFENVRIVEDVERIFGGSRIAMSQLMFEVTERQPLPDIRKARVVIAKLQALGAKVALDDVGTGHGGLSYLLKLGVDVMKMDKMFVDAIGTDRYSIAIVDSLVRLADDMGLELIAEGVETFEQVQYLRDKGVRMAQGYVFAPPLSASSYLALVQAMTPQRPAEKAASDGPQYRRGLRNG
jgi:sensor c-di-GMP phosphodiesterase-like protein